MSGSKEEEGALAGEGARLFALGCVGRGEGRVVTLVGGTGARVGAGTGGGGAADTLCDRSPREALGGRVCCPEPSWWGGLPL